MTAETASIQKHYASAQKAMQAGDYRAAHQHCLAILKINPTFADAWFFCAVIAASNGLPTKAVEILDRALTLSPNNAEYHAEKGKHLLAIHELEQAISHANIAWNEAPNELPTLNTLGTVFGQAGEHTSALQCYQKAIQILKNSNSQSTLSADWLAELHFNYGASAQFAGRFEEAEIGYETAIEKSPYYFKAHSSLSTLRKQSAENNHLERLNGLRSRVETARDQLHLGHAIAKEKEDLGEHMESLETLQWAKERQILDTLYRFENDLQQFDAVRAQFSLETLTSNQAGCDTQEPIFIVGMPRTGTTLVEQIVSSHSEVFAAGELQNFPLQVKRATQTTTADVLDLETLKASSAIDMNTLGETYLQSTRPRTGHTPRFIDKLPLNFMYLGLIHQALPNAKIICLRRDPMDTCLSNYRQLFAVDFKHYHYNYDLLTCGKYYIEFDRLMRHWQEAIPGKVHEVSYEALVENPEKTAQALVEYCDLGWESQCLDFHQRKTSVATPSAVQVRQGIYQTSVNRWQRYGDAMQPLYELLQSAGFYSK